VAHWVVIAARYQIDINMRWIGSSLKESAHVYGGSTCRTKEEQFHEHCDPDPLRTTHYCNGT
jgi:hypothetical protein